jgi:hypothetical protein
LEKQLTQLKLRNPFYNLWYTIADMWQASRNIAGPAKRVAHPRSSARVPRWLKRAGDLLTWALAASVVLAVIAAGVSYITSLHPSAASPSSSTAPAQLRSAIVNTPSDIGVLYRTAPRMNATAGNGPQEGETVYLIERVAGEQGETWWKVRQQDGRINYIPAAWLQIK